MKNILILIIILLSSLQMSAQVWTEIPAGKYYVSTAANDSDIVKKSDRLTSFWTYTGTGSLVADTVFYVPSTAPNDTIATLMTAANNQGDAAILFQRGSHRRTGITVSNDSLKFSSYGTGTKPIIDGADVITGFTEISSGLWYKTGFSTQANLMYLNDTVGMLQTSSADCDTLGQWFWTTAGSDSLFVYSPTDPSGNVELGQRSKLIDVSSREHITLKNLTIQHSNERSSTGLETWWGGVYMSGGSNLTMEGCTVQKCGWFGVQTRNSSFININNSVFLRNGETAKGRANVYITATTPGISNISFTNNQCNYSGGEGLFVIGSTKANIITTVDIHGNHFDNNNAAGLYVINIDSAVVYNNYLDGNGDAVDTNEDYAIAMTSIENTDVYNNTATNQLYNDVFQIYSDTTALWGEVNNVRIFNNKISGANNASALSILEYHPNSMTNLEVFYNLIYNNTGDAISLWHNGTGTPDVVNIYNNTLANNSSNGLQQSTSYPIALRNNLFYGNTSVDVNMNASTSGFTSSNNLYYRTSGDVLSYNGTSYTSSTIRNLEATAITNNPLFVDAGNDDFRLQPTSPAINSGVDVSLTHDILGNPIVGNPDIGAYECDTCGLDITAPTLTAFVIPATSYSLTVTASSLTATDNIAVTGYMIKETSTRPLSSDAGWTSSTSYTFSTEGSKTLYAWAKDGQGNVSDSIVDNVFVTIPVNIGGTSILPITSTYQQRRANFVTIPYAAEILSTTVYHAGGTGNVLMAVYADDGSGNPTTLLGTTAATAVNASAGWQTISLSSPVTVTAGQKVWIALIFENAVVGRYDNGSTPRAASTANYATGMTDPWGTVTFANYDLSQYCTYVKTE